MYLAVFAAVVGIAAAIAYLSVIVAPVGAKSDGPTLLAIALGGLGVAGGVVYLAEKLINLAKGVGFMLAELIVEKFKKREREIGIAIGRQEGRVEGRVEGRQEGRVEGRVEGRQEGRVEGRQEGRVEGRVEGHREWQAWYERQQAALREGRPFDEPPPGYTPESHSNGA